MRNPMEYLMGMRAIDRTAMNSRYMWVNLWSSTEEVIARELSSSPERAYLWGERKRRTTVEARIQSTYHARYGEALVHMRKLLARPR